MKFQINLDTIKNYLKKLSTSVQIVTSRVEFTGVLISVWDNAITFEGRSDWMDTIIEETSLESTRIIETGKVLVQAQKLNEIVQKMEGSYVTFTKVDSNILTIEDSNSNYQMNLLSDEKYENATLISTDDANEVISIPSNIFREAATKVSFAGDENHQRFIFQGLNISINNGILRATGCDGKVIAIWEKEISSNFSLNKIIPIKVVRELVKILPENAEYKFLFSRNKCLLISGNMTNQFSLIEGTFPVFDKFFNEDIYTKKLMIKKEVIFKAVERATILAGNSSIGSRILLKISEEKINISSSTEIGSANIEIRDFKFVGEDIEIAVAPKIISDGIKHISSEDILLSLNNSNSPILLKSDKDSFIYLMSPMA